MEAIIVNSYRKNILLYLKLINSSQCDNINSEHVIIIMIDASVYY
jgi:hypothetical protein